jgi:hypothetical protein
MAMRPNPRRQTKAEAEEIKKRNKSKRVGTPQDNGRNTSVKKINGKYQAVTFANNTKQESYTRAVPLKAMSAAQRGNAAKKKAVAKKNPEGPKKSVPRYGKYAEIRTAPISAAEKRAKELSAAQRAAKKKAEPRKTAAKITRGERDGAEGPKQRKPASKIYISKSYSHSIGNSDGWSNISHEMARARAIRKAAVEGPKKRTPAKRTVARKKK